MSVVGLDLGTSGVRALALAADGSLIASAARALTLTRRATGRVELDAADVVAAAEEVVREVAMAAAFAQDPVEAVAFSVLGEAVVPIDATGEPTAPVAVSMDTRGSEAAAALGATVGAEQYTALTGQPLHGMFSVFKIMAGGDGWENAAGYRCMGDLLAERWTGVAGIDISQAARMGVFDVARGEWSADLLAAATERAPWLRPERLPSPVCGGEVIGQVSAAASARLGLGQGTPVVAGAHDQAAAYLGAGGTPEGPAVINLGSSDCVTVGTRARPAVVRGSGFASYRVDRDLWVTLAGTAAGGWTLAWFADLVQREVSEVFDDLAQHPPALLVLPYLAGSGTLDNDPSARGVIHGLTLETTTPQIARAVVEAAGYEFAKITAACREGGVAIDRVHVTGSGSENRAALQARVDASALAMTPVAADASARGAAMLAMRALGGDPGPLAAPPLAPHPTLPHDASAAWYARQRAAYVDLFDATRAVAPHFADAAPGVVRPHPHEKETHQ